MTMKNYLSLLFLISTFSIFHAQANDSLDNIKKTHEITLSYSNNDYPFSFIQNEKPVGMAIDLCQELVHQLEKQLDIAHIDIHWVGGKQVETFNRVKEHRVDMTCSAITRNDARLKSYNFSKPYFVTTTAFLSKKSDAIHEDKGLHGKTIAVISGDSTIGRINNLNHKLNFSLLMVRKPDYSSALELFKSGGVKMLATDEVLLAAFLAKDPKNYSISHIDFVDTDVYGLMLAKESLPLTSQVNKALAQIITSGEYNVLYNKWFMSPIPPAQQNLNMPMSKALKTYINSYKPVVAS